jgi:hypothetical protein
MTGGAGRCGRRCPGSSSAFHTALGFTVTAPIPGYDGESSPKVVFERRRVPDVQVAEREQPSGHQ